MAGRPAADGDVRVAHPRITFFGPGSVDPSPVNGRDSRGIGGDAPPVAGDVEIDLQPGGWRAHGHDQNPAFKNVILHVIWNGAPAAGSKNQGPDTVLALEIFLDAPLGELARALENESGLPEALRGKCCAPLQDLSAGQLADLLQSAAKVRFQNKASAILARAKNCGWEQALWENLFRALGYKHNVWPMQNLAETKSRWSRGANSAFELQARLLGVSGLLPDELTRAQKNTDTLSAARVGFLVA